jgi:D-tyrosyl-tRNA(Tyr) deacylase
MSSGTCARSGEWVPEKKPTIMRALIQRVNRAAVRVAGQVVGEVEQGLLVLVGVEEADAEADIDWLAGKLVAMRLFADEEGKMNRSLIDVGGRLLLVSQFTLHASCKKGNRPSFIRAARPEQAERLYQALAERLATLLGQPVERGVFGADMQVSLENDGPVTIWLDTKAKE